MSFFFSAGATSRRRALERGQDKTAAGTQGLFVGQPPARWKPRAEHHNFPHAQGHEQGGLVSFWAGVRLEGLLAFAIYPLLFSCSDLLVNWCMERPLLVVIVLVSYALVKLFLSSGLLSCEGLVSFC